MKAVNHSQHWREVVSGNIARSQKTNRGGKKKHPRLTKTQVHQNTPSRTPQTESSTSYSTLLAAVNASPPNAGHHSGPKSKRPKRTMHQTPVYIEPDTDADGHGEPVHLCEGSSHQSHVALLHWETEHDTEIDQGDLDCLAVSAE